MRRGWLKVSLRFHKLKIPYKGPAPHKTSKEAEKVTRFMRQSLPWATQKANNGKGDKAVLSGTAHVWTGSSRGVVFRSHSFTSTAGFGGSALFE